MTFNCKSKLSFLHKIDDDPTDTLLSFKETSLLQKGVCLTLMLISNAMVWRYFVKGLHSNDSSTLVPTVVSTAANFIISGILGKLVFSESTNLLWCIGAGLVLLGLYCIISEDEHDKDKKI